MVGPLRANTYAHSTESRNTAASEAGSTTLYEASTTTHTYCLLLSHTQQTALQGSKRLNGQVREGRGHRRTHAIGK